MNLKKLTWDDFPDPCYNPQDKYGDFNGTILDILNDSRIPDGDKLWAATRPDILDDKTLRLFACKCVREVWHLLTDERSKNAVIVAEKYAIGEASQEELDAEWDAWDAAWAAARAAADAAADAARAAVWAAADAARAAVWAAADAARAAVWNAARAKQIEILKEMIL